MKREPIKIPGRTAELISRTEAHHHVIDDDRHFLVLECKKVIVLTTSSLMSTVFQEFNNGEVGPPFRMNWHEPNAAHNARLMDWTVDVQCEPVRAETTIVFVPDRGSLDADAK